MGNIQIFSGVSINLKYEDYDVIQSGVLINNCVFTTGALILPYAQDLQNINITVYIERNGTAYPMNGFISCVLESRELKMSLAQLDLDFHLMNMNINFFSSFLMIEMTEIVEGNFSSIEISRDSEELFNGLDIMTVSTPFGLREFLNCFSKGIISKLIDGAVFITDTRLSPGCEGGPIYTLNGPPKLIGLMLCQMLAPPYSTCYNLCCHFRVIYEAYCVHRNIPILPPSLTNSNYLQELTPIQRVSSIVLPVRAGSSKGSCVIVDGRGLLVTCSHVINYDVNEIVEVLCGGVSFTAIVLCCSSIDDTLDIAFLLIPFGMIRHQSCTFYNTNPTKGENVFALGFKFYNDKVLQVVSKGTILIHDTDGPLYTDCITHEGYSGGGIFREDGTIVAIVCGIITKKTAKGEIPNNCHNVNIPAGLLKQPIDRFFETGDSSHLSNLCSTKNLTSSKWHLLAKSKL